MIHPFFSIIIPTTNERSSLFKLVEQFDIESFNNFELIIVAQGNNLKSTQFKHCTNLKNKIKVFNLTERRLSRAKNFGLLHSKGKYIFFIDDDCEIYGGFLNLAHKTIIEKSVDVLFGSIYDKNLNIYILKHWPVFDLNDVHSIKAIYLTSSVTIFYNASLIRKFIFDEDFGINAKFNGNEDVELIMRIFLSELQFKSYYCAKLHVKHPIISSTNNYSISFGSAIIKNLSPIFFLYFILTIVWNLFRGLLYLFTLDLKKSKLYFYSIILRVKGMFFFLVS